MRIRCRTVWVTLVEPVRSDASRWPPGPYRWRAMSEQIPLVDYLVLGDQPHLVADECTSCGARYFDRRNACASCFGTDFKQVDVATEGTVNTFTIVAFAAPGIPVPFVSAVVDCDGTPVRGNLINVEPDPDHVSTGMKVRLATYSLGTDDNGTEAIGFGFEPAATDTGSRIASLDASERAPASERPTPACVAGERRRSTR